MKFLVMLLVLFTGLFAWAQVAPPEDATGMMAYLGAFIEAVSKGDWTVIIGVALMGIGVIIRQYVLPKAKIDQDHLPLIMAALVGIGTAGVAMVTQKLEIGEALKASLLTTGVAMLAWETLGKFVFKKVLGMDMYQKEKQLF